MIRLSVLVFMNDAANNCADGLCGDVQNWGASIQSQLDNISGGTVFFVEYPESPDVQLLNVTTDPTIVFVNEDSGLTITRLVGSNISEANYQRILKEINTAQAVPGTENGTATYVTGSGYQFGAQESSFGLLSFGRIGDLPAWIWLLIGGLGTYKSITTKSTSGKIGFSLLSTYSFIQYSRKRNG